MIESGKQKRRLATILAADVVGYSKLMALDEEATVRTLKSHRQFIDRLIDRHDGRIFNTGGDSVLVEFGSAVEAVRCAIAIQDELRIRNAELVAERQMRFRIGINVGDVLVDGDDLLGDGINVAARLEGLAPPDGIYISGSTFEQVKNKLSIGFEDLGLQQVKNIPDPIAAFGITSAPVSVVDGAAAADQPISGTAPVGLRKQAALVGAGIVTVLLAAGLGYRAYFATPASLPDNTSTDQLRSQDIALLMAGMTIRGNRVKDGQPFTIALMPDKTAVYEFAIAGTQDSTKERLTGTWRAEDFRFCMTVPQFASGRNICPKIVKTGQTMFAVRRDGSRLEWSIGK